MINLHHIEIQLIFAHVLQVGGAAAASNDTEVDRSSLTRVAF